MEFLSANVTNGSNPVYLVMQTPESVAQGYNADGTSTFEVVQLEFDPANGLHEYRFDWLSDKVSFYADGNWIQDLEWEYSETPGHLTINHWSNGNPKWSSGPPATDALLTVAYVKAYFNSSTSNNVYSKRCPSGQSSSTICQIPTINGPPAAEDQFGTWFDRGMCGEAIKATASSTSGSSSSTQSGALTCSWTTRGRSFLTILFLFSVYMDLFGD